MKYTAKTAASSAITSLTSCQRRSIWPDLTCQFHVRSYLFLFSGLPFSVHFRCPFLSGVAWNWSRVPRIEIKHASAAGVFWFMGFGRCFCNLCGRWTARLALGANYSFHYCPQLDFEQALTCCMCFIMLHVPCKVLFKLQTHYSTVDFAAIVLMVKFQLQKYTYRLI